MATEEILGAREVALTDGPGAAAANPRKRANSNMVCVWIDVEGICNEVKIHERFIYTLPG